MKRIYHTVIIWHFVCFYVVSATAVSSQCGPCNSSRGYCWSSPHIYMCIHTHVFICMYVLVFWCLGFWLPSIQIRKSQTWSKLPHAGTQHHKNKGVVPWYQKQKSITPLSTTHHPGSAGGADPVKCLDQRWILA